MVKKLLVFVTAFLAALALAGGKAETAAAQDNAAVAINTHDGAEIIRFAFKIARVNQDVVDNTNAAVAFSSCTECETIAVAFQVVLIFSDPAIVNPENLALALNVECSACESFASAYQFVLTTGGPVHFTAEGNQRIAEIRRALLELLQSDLSFEELQAALDELADQIEDVIANELASAGPSDDTTPPEEPTETDTTPTETTTTEPTETTTTTTTETGTTTTSSP